MFLYMRNKKTTEYTNSMDNIRAHVTPNTFRLL